MSGPRVAALFIYILAGVRQDEGREGGLGGANSASSYINDPFGHSSKEVLYKTRLFASLALQARAHADPLLAVTRAP